MDLDLDIGKLSLRGRKPVEVTAEVVGELSPTDLAALAEERGTKPLSLKRISQRHHMLARLIANGAKQSEAALACGLTQSRVSILMQDDMFIDLIKHYEKHADAESIGFFDEMMIVGKDALSELSDRLNDKPEEFTSGQLLAIIEKLADRTGHGPSALSTDLNTVNDFASRLEAARTRVRAARAKDITPRMEIEDGKD